MVVPDLFLRKFLGHFGASVRRGRKGAAGGSCLSPRGAWPEAPVRGEEPAGLSASGLSGSLTIRSRKGLKAAGPAGLHVNREQLLRAGPGRLFEVFDWLPMTSPPVLDHRGPGARPEKPALTRQGPAPGPAPGGRPLAADPCEVAVGFLRVSIGPGRRRSQDGPPPQNLTFTV